MDLLNIIMTVRPFRLTHHTCSSKAFIGDRIPKTGEVSLTHQGVLLLDELPELSNNIFKS